MDELRTALELATDDELRDLTEVLFCRKFNPLDYVNTPDPIDVQSQDRETWLDTLEKRFRFLAADGVTVLQRRTDRVTYRQILVQVCRYLKIPYQKALATTELEAEIFLNLLSRAWKQLPANERGVLTQRVQQSLVNTQLVQQLPLPLQKDPIGLLLKGSSALAVSSVLQPLLLRHLARQFAIHFATYQVAKDTLIRSGAVAAAQFQNYVVLQTAGRKMALSAARYGAVRGVFAVMGPALWAWFFADLGWRAIATNYGRVIPIIFALAQIRLTRTDCLDAV